MTFVRSFVPVEIPDYNLLEVICLGGIPGYDLCEVVCLCGIPDCDPLSAWDSGL